MVDFCLFWIISRANRLAVAPANAEEEEEVVGGGLMIVRPKGWEMVTAPFPVVVVVEEVEMVGGAEVEERGGLGLGLLG